MRNTDEIRELANRARDGYAKELRKFTALAKANGWAGRQGGMLYLHDEYKGVRGWRKLASHVYLGSVVLLDAEALHANALREIGEKEVMQATPAYWHFVAAVRRGGNYQAALDILHDEASTHAERLRQQAESVLDALALEQGRPEAFRHLEALVRRHGRWAAVMNALHAEALAEVPAAPQGFDWSTVQAGDVLVWKPGKQSRRVLVETVDEKINPNSTFRMVWGVEVGQQLQPRLRRGVRNWSRQRPYLVWDEEVTKVIRGDQRAANTAARVEARRVERAQAAVSYR